MNDDSGKTKISNLFSSKVADGGEDGGDPTQDYAGSMVDGADDQDPGTFVGNPSDASAPFSSDFKSDLASQLSMDLSGASGVSQFLRDSARNETIRNIAIVVGGVLVLGVGGMFILKSGDSDPSTATSSIDSYDEYSADQNSEDTNEFSDDNNSYDEDYDGNSADQNADDAFSADQSDDSYYDELNADTDSYDTDSFDSMAGSGQIQLLTPLDGQRRNYDETSEYALFEWSGGEGGQIHFSRSETMEPLEKKVTVAGNSYTMAHPWPGVWYWQVVSEAGTSPVSRFYVDAPQRRNIQLMPLGGSLAGSGGVISWQGDSKVARYVVELSQSGWSNPEWRFQTSSTSLTLANVMAGSYKLRVGAFSEVAGRWEYTTPVDVAVE